MTSIQSNTEYDYNTTTLQMGFRRKSNNLFESVSQRSNASKPYVYIKTKNAYLPLLFKLHSIYSKFGNLISRIALNTYLRRSKSRLGHDLPSWVIFYVRRIGLYLFKYRINGIISIHILKGLTSVFQLIQILHN